MRIHRDYYLIIDFEATCSEDRSVPRDQMEIIEIGALLQNSDTFEVESEFQTFVRPVRNPTLTEFCTQLTTIVQSDVDLAPLFPAALGLMNSWLSSFESYLFCSWGAYDRNQLQQDCAYHSVDYPFDDEHLNLKQAFSDAMGTRKRFGLGGALRKLQLTFEGTPHRGIDDVRNIARVVRQAGFAMR